MLNYIHELISQRAELTPRSTALQVKENRLSYQQLHLQVQEFSCYLARFSKPEQRIGIYLNKNIENVVTMFACSVAELIFVPINPVLKSAQVQHIVDDCQIQTLVTNKARLAGLAKVLPSLSSIENIIIIDANSTDIEEFSDNFPIINFTEWPKNVTAIESSLPKGRDRSSHDLACILYTSGSTGNPKGIMISHHNLILGAESVSQYLQNTAKDKILAVLPLSFDYGLNQLTCSFLVGAQCILLDYLFAKDVINAIEKYDITGLAAVPALWSQLCQINWQQQQVKSIRYFTNSGGVLAQQHLDILRTRMPKAKPFLMYGLTEAFRSTYLSPDEIDKRVGSIGKAIPNAEIKVLRSDGSECDVGEEGQLVHIGPLVTLGYWQNPAKTKERFKPYGNANNIAVFSGDYVKKDSDGFLYFVGRHDEMIKTSGYRVSPSEIEECLSSLSVVSTAVVFGKPDSHLGQLIIAQVQLAEQHKSAHELTALKQEINQTCKKQLANYMQPHELYFIDEFPINANGKIDRNKVRLNYLANL
ncbi:acyl-CoA ligase (AMP-forming), exosortase A system-associated [Colwellia sp. RSH04]|uniref:acyl-CoA ligase (AMP-forming), exosortase A system-associated n=1 Tax=Colwellia sp. RSH04 TaxID=2305464 RepID=UPI000E5903AE|nr:acyl-CoA ligase (AMP-forming), exosortase A system-associated [Colwellia sp. RSH04]RHW76873.1 acyl-CoA ligase (AMP-forming), exosortase A system-associated [Colwellia sp. RSH04]